MKNSTLDQSARLAVEGARMGARYLQTLNERAVIPSADAIERTKKLGGPLPESESDPMDVLRALDEFGSPATMATAGGRYFGFVLGGSLPACVGASVLAAAWDQCAGLARVSPIGAKLEDIARGWILDALSFDPTCAVGFTTGATMANLSCMAAARRSLLLRKGWDVDEQGLFGAPEVRVIVGEDVHVSVLKALGLLGFGRSRVEHIECDDQGRMVPGALPQLTEPALLCVNAGNVNSGAIDPVGELCEWADASDSWVHVDGAFGLWAAACPTRAHLIPGIERAHSWSADAHKWLNVPYDSGLAICRDGESLRGAMRFNAPYIEAEALPDPADATPEMSRRARGIEVWAALRSLGRSGIADLVERCCQFATRFADGLRDGGYEVLNEVTLNQVMVSFGSDERTARVIAALQAEGTCWCGGTTWRGRSAMRIAVSSWATTPEDVERSLAAMLRVAEGA